MKVTNLISLFVALTALSTPTLAAEERKVEDIACGFSKIFNSEICFAVVRPAPGQIDLSTSYLKIARTNDAITLVPNMNIDGRRTLSSQFTQVDGPARYYPRIRLTYESDLLFKAHGAEDQIEVSEGDVSEFATVTRK